MRPSLRNSPRSLYIKFDRGSIARILGLLGLCVLLLPAAAPRATQAADKVSPQRGVDGRVLNNNDVALPNAIVYLQDMNSMKVLSLFPDENGNFTYGELDRTVDYRVWAEYKGKKSPQKLLSSFVNTDMFHVRLRIDVAK